MIAFANKIPGYTENVAGNAIDSHPHATVVLLGRSDFPRLSFCPACPLLTPSNSCDVSLDRMPGRTSTASLDQGSADN